MPLVDGFDDTSILSIGHLGIVAGAYDSLQIADVIDLSSRVLGAYLSKTRLNPNIVGYLTIYELVDVLNN
jgi:hypothetical protein